MKQTAHSNDAEIIAKLTYRFNEEADVDVTRRTVSHLCFLCEREYRNRNEMPLFSFTFTKQFSVIHSKVIDDCIEALDWDCLQEITEDGKSVIKWYKWYDYRYDFTVSQDVETIIEEVVAKYSTQSTELQEAIINSPEYTSAKKYTPVF